VPEVADLIRQFHWLEEPESLGLSAYDPLAEWDGRMAALTGVSEDDREFLGQRAEELRKLYSRLDFVLPYGIIHGDANIGNAIRNRDGRAILIDLDGVSVGQREWDLVQTTMFYERYGWHTREQYEAFVFHYGFDLMNWPGYPVLADLRELLMVAWLGGKVNGEPEVRAEFDKRMRAVRTAGNRGDWAPL
jgi:aminoglycoside phosphotransferase (APT) family kinase protein